MSWSKVITKGNPPHPRHSTALTVIGQKVYLFGGTRKNEAFNDLHVLDLGTFTWSEVAIKSEKPPPRWGHAMSTYKDTILVFGGETVGGKTHDTWCFDTTKSVWSKPSEVKGAVITPRSYHTSSIVVDDEYIFIFGGDGVSQPIQNLHYVHLANWTWSRVDAYGDLPDPRKRHSMVYYDYKLWVFGGFCLRTNQHLTDLNVYDIGKEEWTTVKQKGPIPEKRAGHGAVVDDDKMYVWGGIGPGGDDWNLLHYYNMDEGVWMKTKGKGTDIPSKRCDHAMIGIGNKNFLLFGGLIDPKEGTVSNECYLLDVKSIY
eukprot:TRINITY_DN3027_c0_g1_i1.p1 TRINITY_DN3027_c0_g1~~TRINITY_DN3027_c0_g1_i1.p1  ORF type:complete len:314 (-),score=47.79 TRINITY_DN3027_c0_g1_i1:37-978(-)